MQKRAKSCDTQNAQEEMPRGVIGDQNRRSWSHGGQKSTNECSTVRAI